MWRARFDHSLQVGFSFGLVSGVITTLGLVVGLAFGTHSRLAVIGGILTIAIADSLSDALGIHISEEAEGIHSTSEIWVSTGATLVAKFATSLSFLVPVLLLDLQVAVSVSVAWGILAVALMSWHLARRQSASVFRVVAEHVGVAVAVVVASALLGRWVARVFS